jgi:hypothetical protein
MKESGAPRSGVRSRRATFCLRFKQTLFVLPKIIDERFEVLDVLDAGGFGCVYSCFDLQNKCKDKLAIKFVRIAFP